MSSGEYEKSQNEGVHPRALAHDLPGIAFGPVPSRRLGRSLGINNIPAKCCSYSCAYCQLGRTIKHSIEREEFYDVKELAYQVRHKVSQALEAGEQIDFLTFVADGEPTLDINLGLEMALLKSLGLKIAVITNSSLLWRNDVRRELSGADYVSVKVDSVVDGVWRKINRPYQGLELSVVLQGIREFAWQFGGELVTETMLIRGANDDLESIERLSDFLCELDPHVAYLAVPTRPPGEKWVQPTEEREFHTAFQLLSSRLDSVESLCDYEGDSFALTSQVADDLRAICSVHPMREEAVERLLNKAGASWSVVEKLMSEGAIVEKIYQGRRFYARRFPRSSHNGKV